MIKNILIYIAILAISFSFSIFYYAWFSNFILIVVLCLPIVSLACSLPFMIYSAKKGFSIYAPKILYTDSNTALNVSANNKNGFFCPLFKIRINASNRFAEKSKKFTFKHSGFLKRSENISLSPLNKYCGCIKIETKWIKIYDMLGIFFIPIKYKASTEILVIPKFDNIDTDIFSGNQTIIGYKKKSGGGFSDDYEIREYQDGDSMKTVHWKLSAKYDKLMVREPSLPIIKGVKIMLMLTDNPTDNNKIIAQFASVAQNAIKNQIPCVICTTKNIGAYQLTSQTNIYSMLKIIFTQQSLGNADANCAEVYNISADTEEASK